MLSKFRKFFVVIPVVYIFVSVFILREKVEYVYFASALLLALTLTLSYRHKSDSLVFLARWMTVLAAIGLVAAVILSIEKVELLADPGRIASCSLSPVVACSPVIASDQASAFGIANSFIGIFAYTAVFTAGITILAGATKLSKLWWRTLLSGIFLGSLFSGWLIYQGIFVIGKLCLYCLLVWIVSYTLFWLTTAYCVEKKHISLGSGMDKLFLRKYDFITATYVLLFAIIFLKWSDYWISLF